MWTLKSVIGKLRGVSSLAAPVRTISSTGNNKNDYQSGRNINEHAVNGIRSIVPERGAFIVFEGLDKSAKSSQAKLLVDRSNDDGISAALSKFPTPQPSTYMAYFMTMCVDSYRDNADPWFYIRANDNKGCKVKLESSQIEENPHIKSLVADARDIVFVAQMPHMRENKILCYSPWFQSLLGVLTIQTQYMPPSRYAQWKMYPDPVLRLEVRMGYNTSHESNDWRELNLATINRKKREGAQCDCDPLELFELGSIDYPFYLVNIRVPHKVVNYGVISSNDQNAGIGRLTGFELIVIHQTGVFMRIWLSMKTVLFPAILASLIWYWRCVRLLARPVLLLAKSLVALGVAMLFIDVELYAANGEPRPEPGPDPDMQPLNVPPPPPEEQPEMAGRDPDIEDEDDEAEIAGGGLHFRKLIRYLKKRKFVRYFRRRWQKERVSSQKNLPD